MLRLLWQHIFLRWSLILVSFFNLIRKFCQILFKRLCWNFIRFLTPSYLLTWQLRVHILIVYLEWKIDLSKGMRLFNRKTFVSPGENPFRFVFNLQFRFIELERTRVLCFSTLYMHTEKFVFENYWRIDFFLILGKDIHSIRSHFWAASVVRYHISIQYECNSVWIPGSWILTFFSWDLELTLIFFLFLRFWRLLVLEFVEVFYGPTLCF